MEQMNHYYRKMTENVIDSWVADALAKSLRTDKKHMDLKVATDVLDILIIQDVTSSFDEVCQNCARGGPGNEFIPKIEPIVEDPLLEVLGLVGIYGDKKVIPKFSNDFHLILDCAKYFPLYFAGSLIVDIDIPVFGCERLDKIELSKLDVNLVNKDTHRSGYFMAMREKMDGMLSLAIKVTTADRVAHTLYWDEEHITCSNFTAHGVFERMDTFYWQLNGVYVPTLNGKNVVYSSWYTLSENLLRTSKEGVILLIDGVEYKLPREKTVTLRLSDGEYVDKNDKVYNVVGEGTEEYSDFIARGDKLCYDKPRLDKSTADTTKSIAFVLNKMAVVDDVLNLFPDGMPSRVDHFIVEKCSSYKDKRSIKANYVYYDHKTYKRYSSIVYMSLLRNIYLNIFFINRNEYYCYGKSYPRYRFVDIKSFYYHGVEFYDKLVPGAREFNTTFHQERKVRATGYMKVFVVSLLLKLHRINREVIKDQFPEVVTLFSDQVDLMLLSGLPNDVKRALHWMNSSFAVTDGSYEITMGVFPTEVYD